jgi:hypothetical protein
MADFPKITNEKLFMEKIYEALVLATDFQIGRKSMIVNDGYVYITNSNDDWAFKVEFIRNNSTMSYKERDSDGRE